MKNKSRRNKKAAPIGSPEWLESHESDDAWSVVRRDLRSLMENSPTLKEYIDEPARISNELREKELADLPDLLTLRTALGLVIAESVLDPNHHRKHVPIHLLNDAISDIDNFFITETSIYASVQANNTEWLEMDLEKYEAVNVLDLREHGVEPTSPIIKLAQVPQILTGVNIGELIHSFLGSIDKEAQNSVEYYLYQFDDQPKNRQFPLPKISVIPTARERRFLQLTRSEQHQVIHDIRLTLLLWKIAHAAMSHPEKPGIIQALVFGVQLPFYSKSAGQRDVAHKQSSLWKVVNRYRATWALVVSKDTLAAQWCALELAPSYASKQTSEAIIGFASADTHWQGRPGNIRRSVPRKVDKWACDTCANEFVPGDSTHDSPNAEYVQSSILDPRANKEKDLYKRYGRILKGLPDTAQEWHRLMCAHQADENSLPCWLNGGVLIPQFSKE